MQQPVTPKTDEEWTIHSLNIHGTHFERYCRYVIERSWWILRQPYYPVEFPVTREGHTVERGKPSNLDLWAEWKAPNGNSSIMLPDMQQVFLPTIVTTAHLFTCDFQDADVDLETGEISLSKASLPSDRERCVSRCSSEIEKA